MLTIEFKGIVKCDDENGFYAESQNENIMDAESLDGLDQILSNFGYSPTAIDEEIEIIIKTNRKDVRTINEQITQGY